MHPSVRNYFIKFNHDFEDTIEHMYLDIKGLVTIGVGNLIDVEKASDTKNLMKVMEELAKLPFVYKKSERNAGQKASPADIEAEWKMVKSEQKKAKEGYRAFANSTKLELKTEAINELALKKADAMEKELTKAGRYASRRAASLDACRCAVRLLCVRNRCRSFAYLLIAVRNRCRRFAY